MSMRAAPCRQCRGAYCSTWWPWQQNNIRRNWSDEPEEEKNGGLKDLQSGTQKEPQQHFFFFLSPHMSPPLFVCDVMSLESRSVSVFAASKSDISTINEALQALKFGSKTIATICPLSPSLSLWRGSVVAKFTAPCGLLPLQPVMTWHSNNKNATINWSEIGTKPLVCGCVQSIAKKKSTHCLQASGDVN